MSTTLGRLVLLAGVGAGLLVAGSGFTYRHAGFELAQAFSLMKYGVYVAGFAALLAAVWLVTALVRRSGEGLVTVVAGLALAGGAAYFPINMQQVAAQVPMIHDITTDTANPPVFVALKAVRDKAPNGADYRTDPSQQLKAYPDLKTMVSPDAPGVLFDKALAAAQAMKWDIASSVREEGRIEATDTTPWFGFKDDVVIRITAEGSGSKLDIRSMSRVGKSDLGKNASRIRAYLAQLKAAR